MATTHYISVFDPEQQTTQGVFKVEIEGVSDSIVHDTTYASGWVDANAVDSITSKIDTEKDQSISITNKGGTSTQISAKRRFYEVGPLGVSTEPEAQRFIIVMGANPEKFFNTIQAISSMQRDDKATTPSELIGRIDSLIEKAK